MGKMMIYAIYTCITITGSLIKFVFTMFKFGHPDLRPHSPCEKSVKHQRGNQKPYIKEEHTIQWPKQKVLYSLYESKYTL